MMRILVPLWSFLLLSVTSFGQFFFLDGPPAVSVELEEVSIPSFPAFHSSAIGYHDGKWIIIGGRTNGLHGFYPPFAFPSNGVQDRIYVIDPDAGSVWSSGLDSLPQPLREQLSSSNMQHCVKGNRLYISGGYGHSATQDEYITFPYFTEVDMDSLAQAVIAGTNPARFFRFTVDSDMAVTGGRMLEKDDRFYLFFGHKFTGRYSSTPGPDFEQQYTYQVRMFDVAHTADSIYITHYSTVTDSVNFRRRDLNVTPYFKPGVPDTLGFMAWSGVFRVDADRPHTDQIFIDSAGSYRIVDHEQKYNQYHCAVIPIRFSMQMPAVIFMGGMAESTRENLPKDTLVPFVKNVSMVSGISNMQESLSADTLDGYWGTNAEFIPDELLFDADSYQMIGIHDCGHRNFIGHIIGGIESTGPHISTFNDPSLSFASGKIYRVYVTWHCWGIDEHQKNVVQVYPNPSQHSIQVQTDEPVVRWQIIDISGKTVADKRSNGTNTLDISDLQKGTYFVKIFTEGNLYRATCIKI